MRIFGNHGALIVSKATGCVIDYEPEFSEEYLNIARFDLEEWRMHYGQVKCDGGDILDFGYWLRDGTYERPEAAWREPLKKESWRR